MEEEKENPRSFCRFLAGLAGEQAEADLSKEMHVLTTKLMLDAKSKGPDGESRGEIKLTLKFVIDSTGHAEVNYNVVTKEPPKRRPKSMVYVTKGGNLAFENPRQQKLPLREVASETKEVKEVDGVAEVREV